MPIRVYYEVLNQKGTPALYSDNYAQRPAAGYQGRIFNSPDTGQIFYDTGTTWTLLADAGVGSGSLASVCANGNTTATGISITAGGLSANSITNTSFTQGWLMYAGLGGIMGGNPNLFYDASNYRLGLGTNTPTAPLDIHITGNIGIQINNTTTADSKIAFLQADAGKWRIGNLYSGGANLFHIYNNVGVTLAMQIDSSNAALFYGSLSANSFIRTNGGLSLIHNSVPTSTGYTGIGGLTAGLSIALASGFNQTLTFPTGVAYTYTFPSATGTLALTSDLSSYLPLTGGTLSGALTINSTLYINPTNTGLTGLDVASNNISFRSDNLEGSKRQLTMTMGSGTLIQFTGQGYGAARATDIAFYTSTAGGVNANPTIYMTGGGLVGIGTGTLSARLSVVSLTGETIRCISVDTIGDNYISYYNSSGTRQGYIGYGASASDSMQIINEKNDQLSFGTNGFERMYIIGSGEIGVGVTPTTGNKFMIKGTSAATGDTSIIVQNSASTNLFYVRNDGAALFPIVGSSYTTGSGANLFIDSGTGQLFRSTSSLKYKIDVIDYNKGLDVIKQMRPVYYKGINDGNKQFAGFIAEEVHDLGLTEFVEYAQDGSPDALAYQNMTALLTKGIQQIDDRLTALEQKIN